MFTNFSSGFNSVCNKKTYSYSNEKSPVSLFNLLADLLDLLEPFVLLLQALDEVDRGLKNCPLVWSGVSNHLKVSASQHGTYDKSNSTITLNWDILLFFARKSRDTYLILNLSPLEFGATLLCNTLQVVKKALSKSRFFSY